MKIATWNINGVKARIENLVHWLKDSQPDIVCLQEIKTVDEGFPRAEIEALGYHVETHGQKGFNGVAILFDCHSIRSHIPFLFDGKLPDFNIGTAGGVTCDPQIENAAVDVASAAAGYTSVLNGRFTGGWTTRHYGQPETGVHAIQLELAQDSHLASESVPYDLDPDKAERLRVHLREMLKRIEAVAPDLNRETSR